MTTKQTLQALRSAGKPIHLSHFYRLVALLGIKPSGHSRPAIYPADTAERLKAHLGIFSGETEGACLASNATSLPAGKLISARTLRAAKPKTKTRKQKG